MATTSISDIIKSERMKQYIVQQSTVLSNVFASGLVAAVPEVGIDGNAETVKMPFWNDLTGASEALSDSSSLTPVAITAGQDIAAVLYRGKAWSVNDLARAMSNDDPAGVIGGRIANWWARDMQTTAINIVKGLFASSGALEATHLNDISGGTGDAAVISAGASIDTFSKLGDHSDMLGGVVMHSAVRDKLRKLDLIATQVPSQNVVFETYLGKRVLVDDSMPVASGVYDTLFFAPGAFGYAEDAALSALEFDRDILAGNDVIASRRRMVIHPRGVKWKGTAAADTITNAELATAANWEKVYDTKNVRFVVLRHKIA